MEGLGSIVIPPDEAPAFIMAIAAGREAIPGLVMLLEAAGRLSEAETLRGHYYTLGALIERFEAENPRKG